MWYILYGAKLIKHNFLLTVDNNYELMFSLRNYNVSLQKRDEGRAVINNSEDYTVDLQLANENELVRILEQLHIIKTTN